MPLAADTEDVYNITDVYLSRAFSKSKVDKEDSFDVGPDQLRHYSGGLDKNFVRRTDRQLRKDLTGANGAKSKQLSPEAITGYTYFDCITPPFNIVWLAKLYDMSPAHRAAVDAKVASVFGLGFDWVESPATTAKKSQTRTEDGLNRLNSTLSKTKLQIQDWLEKTNSEDVFEETIQRIGCDWESTGNGYMEIGRDNRGDINYIGHIPSAYVRVRKDRDGFVQIFANRVVFFRNFGSKDPNPVTNDKNPNEIIHFKKYSPLHMYYGVPDIIAAQNALAGNEFASRYNLDFFENKAVPRNVIVARGAELSNDARNKIVEFFEAGLRGQHHRSIYIPLPKDKDVSIEFQSIEEGTQDFSFGNYRKANNEEIFMAHRMPATRAGVFDSNVALAAAQEADKVFKESYSNPTKSVFEKKVKKVFAEITDMFIFELNELSLTDANTQSQIDERDLRNQVKNPNEVRKERGMGPRPDGKGDEVLQLKAQAAADAKANQTKTKARDANRSANKPSDPNNAATRNPKGAGRQQS